MDELLTTSIVAGNTILSIAILYVVIPLSRLTGQFDMLRGIVDGHENRIQTIERVK